MITNAKIIGKSVNPEDYHRAEFERGDMRFAVSSSQLREFYRCPSRWIAGYNPPESDAKTWGSLLDTLLLTPEQFRDRFAVKPETYTNEKDEVKPWNGNSNTCKAWLADHEHLEIISKDEHLEASKAITRLMRDPQIAQYVEESDKQVYVAAQWQDEDTGLTIPIKALLDLVPRADSIYHKTACDLKSTRNASQEAWARWCYAAGYHIQGAFMLDLLKAALPNEDRNTWCFILSENFAPYQTGKRILGEQFLDLGRAEYTKMLKLYAKCLKHGKWPDYDDTDESADGWAFVTPAAWMESAALFSPKFEMPEPESENNHDQGIIP